MNTRQPHHNHPRARSGFSLLELLIVVMILGLLAALVGPKVVKQFSTSKVTTTMAQISLLDGAVNRFFADVSRYPTEAEGLQALIDEPKDAEGWNGPYLEKQTLPTDGWKHDFVYQLDEKWDFIIISYGSDGKEGGDGEAADLNNRS